MLPLAVGALTVRVMLSLGKVTAGNRGYHEAQTIAADYYLAGDEPPGVFIGRAAEQLGLAGQVTTEQFNAMLDGYNPATGERLRERQTSVLAIDGTFSAPKSVSLLAFCSDEQTQAAALAAHDSAVRAALAWVEDEVLEVRRGAGGIERHRATGLLGVAFQQSTSREHDPQLHTHVVWANLAQSVDDHRWTAQHTDALFKCAKTAGTLYQAELRRLLSEELGVEWTEVVKGQAEVVGIDPAVLEEFSERRRQIEADMAQSEQADTRAAWQNAALGTRRSKEHEDLTALKQQWRQRTVEHDLAPEQLRAAVTDREPVLTHNAVAVADELAGPEGLTENRTWVDRRDVLQAFAAQLPGATTDQIVAAADRWLGEQVELFPDSYRQRIEHWQLRHTTEDMLKTEASLLELATTARPEPTCPLPDEVLDEVIERYTLTPEQADAARLLGAGAGTDLVLGVAGAGKTHALKAMRDAWEAQGVTVIGAATSAKAARNLEQGSGIESSTVSGLLRAVENGRREVRTQDGRRWADFHLDSKTVVVVDEAGMTGTRDLHQLLTGAREAGAKVVLVGDTRQLPSIAAGGAIRALAERMPHAQLSETVRAQEDWERVMQVRWHQGDAAFAVTELDTHDRLHINGDRAALREQMLQDWLADREKLRDGGIDPNGPDRPLLLAQRRLDVATLNAEARAALIAEGVVNPERSTVGAVELADGQMQSVQVSVGDRVITTAADRSLGVINGNEGTVVDVTADGGVTVALFDGGNVTLPAEYLAEGNLLHAYALTAHRAQGSTVPVARVLGDYAMTGEWAYSAATRGRQNHLYFHPDVDDDREPEQQVLSALQRDGQQHAAVDLAIDADGGAQPTAEDFTLASSIVRIRMNTAVETDDDLDFDLEVEAEARRLATERATDAVLDRSAVVDRGLQRERSRTLYR